MSVLAEGAGVASLSNGNPGSPLVPQLMLGWPHVVVDQSGGGGGCPVLEGNPHHCWRTRPQ